MRGAFDSDVVVAWPGPKRTACQAIARRLDVEGSAFKVDHVGQRLVLVIYRGELEVDIVPQQHIEARGGPYAHVRNFEQAPEAHNHLVRILKGWARLRCRAPGILLEVVARAARSGSSSLWSNFIRSLQLLRDNQSWLDPTDSHNDFVKV